MIKTLYIFRHGQTDWNLVQRLQGHTDVPLNAEGRKQAATLQHYFARNPVDLFYSSDLQRAVETARIANKNMQKPLLTSMELRESFMGDAEGKTKSEVTRLFGEKEWLDWNSVSPEHADARLPGSESSRETVGRVLKCLTDFCQAHEFTAAAICTHGLVLRRVIHFIQPDLREVLPVPNCGVYTVIYDPQKRHFTYKA